MDKVINITNSSSVLKKVKALRTEAKSDLNKAKKLNQQGWGLAANASKSSAMNKAKRANVVEGTTPKKKPKVPKPTKKYGPNKAKIK